MLTKISLDLRKFARGQDCQVRVPGVCNFNPETTVLAHVRMAGITGTGIKASDLCAAICCSACHDATEGRTVSEHTEEELWVWFLEGVIRTLDLIAKECRNG